MHKFSVMFRRRSYERSPNVQKVSGEREVLTSANVFMRTDVTTVKI